MPTRFPKRPRVEVVELDGRNRSTLARRQATLVGYPVMVAIGIEADMRDGVVDALGQLASAVNTGGGRLDVEALIDELVDELVVRPEVVRPLVDAAHREAELRSRILRDHSRPEAVDPAAAAQWVADGRLFSVPVGGEARYLAFQFGDDGQPRAVVAEVLAALEGWPPWEVAAWFVLPNPLLRQARPVTLLDRRPSAVADAARRDAAHAARAHGRLARPSSV